mgnify:CR=1 FL=1
MSEEQIKKFYSDLRKIKGKFAIFLGAGSSYDFGIPTMYEMAKNLHEEVINGTNTGISATTQKLLTTLTGISANKQLEQPQCNWNIENLLTRLHQIREALEQDNPYFREIKFKIGRKNFNLKHIITAEEELINYICSNTQLTKKDNVSHGCGSVEYLSNFIELMGCFQKKCKYLYNKY